MGKLTEADDTEELPETNGYTFTHWDCDCGEVNHEEGDATNDVVTCPSCGGKFKISLVM